jgi:hypothetical protein
VKLVVAVPSRLTRALDVHSVVEDGAMVRHDGTQLGTLNSVEFLAMLQDYSILKPRKHKQDHQ